MVNARVLQRELRTAVGVNVSDQTIRNVCMLQIWGQDVLLYEYP
jgi:hypothetical protein